jgi:hypothetical protein
MSKRLRNKSENRDAILAFVECGGDQTLIELNEVQNRMLIRWRAADELIRKGGEYFLRENVVKKLMFEFSISRDTAYQDVVSAEHVFSSSAPLNKRYWIQRRVEYLQQIIDKLVQGNTESEVDENGKNIVTWTGDADAMEVAAKWESVLQKYIDKFPDFIPARSPKKIIYNIQNNLLVNNTTTVMEANEKYEQVLKHLEEHDDY